MTTSVDNRVVQMQFDNAQFEKNIKQSMTSLQNMDKGLQLKNGQKGMSVLSKFGNFAKNAGIAALNTSISGIGTVLTTVGNTASSVFNGITSAASFAGKSILTMTAGLGAAAIAQATAGGVKRAMNIEQAKFQLEGLGVAWKDIEGDINYAVKGTAYGLDSAAKAAAQLSASGIELGDSMKTALRGISGVAAMTNSDYDSIAAVFTTVAGQGKLMTMQLRQLEARGLNAAAKLGEALGKTEAEIRDMVTQGEIDFKTFAAAMDDAFGEHAKDANKTFTGAFSNVRAALSRIGADFAASGMENLRKIFVDLIPVIDDFHAATKPLANLFDVVFRDNVSVITRWLQSFHQGGGLQEVAKGLDAYVKSLLGYKETVSDDPINPGLNPVEIEYGFKDVVSNLSRVATLIGARFQAVFYSLKAGFKDVFGDFEMPELPTLKTLLDATNGMIKFVESIKIAPKALQLVHRGSAAFFTILNNGIETIKNIADVISNFFSSNIADAGDLLGKIGEGLVLFLEALAYPEKTIEGLPAPIRILASALNALQEGFKGIFSEGGPAITVLEGLKTVFSSILSGGVNVITMITDAIATLIDKISQLDSVKNFGKTLADIFTSPVNALQAFTAIVGGVGISKLFDRLNNLTGRINTIASGLDFKSLLGIGPQMDELKKSLIALQATLKVDQIFKIAAAIGVLALSMKLLSTIDPISLASSLGAIAVLMNLLEGFGTRLANFDIKKLYVLDKLAGVFIAFSIAILILSGAVRAIGNMELGSAIQGVIGVGALAAVLTGVAYGLSKMQGKITQGAMSLILISISLNILAGALKLLGSMSYSEMEIALISMAAGLGMMVAALALISAIGESAGRSITSSAKAMTSVAMSMLILSAALKLLSTINPEQMGTALTMFAAGLGGMVLALALMQEMKGVTKAGASMLLLANALLVMSISMKVLSSIDSDRIASSLILLAGGLLIMVSAMYGARQAAAGAPALLILAASLAILAPALALISAIPIPGIAAALLMLSGVFLILGVAAEKIPGAKLMAIGAGLLMIGVGVLAVGAGLFLALTGLAAFISTIAGLAPATDTALSDMITAITSHMADIALMGVMFIMGFLEAVSANIGKLVDVGINIVINLINGISSKLGALIDAGVKLIISFINGIANAINTNKEAILGAVKNLMNAVIGFVIEAIAGLVEMIPGVGPELANGMRAWRDETFPVAVETGEAITEGVAEGSADAPEAAGEAMEGVAEAVEDGGSDVKDASENVASGMISTFNDTTADLPDVVKEAMADVKSAQQSASSDFEAAGQENAEGYNSGLVSNLEKSSGDATEVVENTVSEMKHVNAQGSGAQVGDEFGKGMYNGVNLWAEPIANKAAEIVTQAKESARQAQDSQSPSKDTMKIGGWFGEGYYIGLNSWGSKISDAAGNMVRGAYNNALTFNSMIEDALNLTDWNSAPVIRPVLDLTEVENGASQIDGLFSGRNALSAAYAYGNYGYSAQPFGSTRTYGDIYMSVDYQSGDSIDDFFSNISRELAIRNRMGG